MTLVAGALLGLCAPTVMRMLRENWFTWDPPTAPAAVPPPLLTNPSVQDSNGYYETGETPLH